MTGQQLKNAILALAVQGKLVPQNPKDEPASALLKRIAAEKVRFVAEGKIKKEKPLPEITEEEKPFEIPVSWEWVRIGNIFNLQAGKNITSSEIKASQDELHPYPCYGGNGLRGYVSRFNRDGNYPLIGRQGALCGNINFVSNKFYATEHAVVTETYCETSVKWAGLFLEALNLNQYATATAQPGLAVKTINQVIIPTPPFIEQQRIVAKIEELLPLVSVYDEAEQKLSAIDEAFPGKLKKSILQQAVQGKLTKQDKNDEPASELLKRIKAEKERLIAEGKIKKEKPLPPITDEEKPFDLPAGWEWVRLGDVTKQIGDIDHKMPQTVKENGIPYISPLDFTSIGINFDSAKQISVEDYERLSKKIFPEKDDIIFPRYGTIGVIRRVRTERKFLASYSCCIIKPLNEFMSLDYMESVLKSPLIQGEINRYINKTTQPNVGLNSIKNFLFPLPPLAEQKRIVEQARALLAACDELTIR